MRWTCDASVYNSAKIRRVCVEVIGDVERRRVGVEVIGVEVIGDVVRRRVDVGDWRCGEKKS